MKSAKPSDPLRTGEAIIDFLKRRLRDAGYLRWEAMAKAAGVSDSLLRKIAYFDRENPGVATIQPVLDYFGRIDRGEERLPEPSKPARKAQPSDKSKAAA